jgi:hypothetical protein
MINFRCELCDTFLNMFQFSHLCENCYKIRTITKCYNSETILNCLNNNFLLSDEEKEKFMKKDLQEKEIEHKELEKEAIKEIEKQIKPKSVEEYDDCINELKKEQEKLLKQQEKDGDKAYNLRKEKKTKSN